MATETVVASERIEEIKMMPTINISDAILADLASLARPFVDHEPQDVIKRLVEHFRSNAVSVQEATELKNGIKAFQPDSPPDLTFTRLKSFKMDGEAVVEKASLYWNPILFAIVAKAAKKMKPDELRKRLMINYVEGEGQSEKGYRFIKEAGLSVQGGDANTVWRAIYELVKAIGMSVEVEFVWEDKPKAAFPNATGAFNYNGK
jgi:hypothetical protein